MSIRIIEPVGMECRTCEHYVLIKVQFESEADEYQREFNCDMIDPDGFDSCYLYDSMKSYCQKWVEKTIEKEKLKEENDMKCVVQKLIDENEHQRLELCNLKLRLDGECCDNGS